MTSSPTAPADIIRVEDVVVSFDDFVVLNHLDFSLRRGELRFLIGPNGAGKTTLMDLLSAKVRAASGSVRFFAEESDTNGADVSKLQEHQLVRMGLARKFQTASVYRSLTCFENIEVALGSRSVLPSLMRRTPSTHRDRINTLLEEMGLAARAHTVAGSLSHGEQQWLEIAILLALEPRVLLLDEPVAGMTRREREATGELLQRLEGKHSIIVTEHDMDFVRQFSRTVTVLHQGKILAEGPVDVIQSDPAVVEVYLGRSRHAVAV